MADGKANTRANNVLSWLLRNTTDTPTSPTEANIKIALTSTGSSASAVGTEITGTGYTAGGQAIGFGAVSSQSTTGDDAAALTWSNGSGGAWTIDGALIHDTGGGGFPATEATVIYFINGLGISVGNGEDLEIAQDGVTITEA